MIAEAGREPGGAFVGWSALTKALSVGAEGDPSISPGGSDDVRPSRRAADKVGNAGRSCPDGACLPPDVVRERFRWAARQGYPTWLWPDVSVARWQAALAAIETALRYAIGGRIAPQPLDGDPEAMSVACYTSGVGPLLGFWAQQGLVPASASVAAVLERHLRHNKARNDQLTAETIRLTSALAGQQGLAIVVLKGLHTAHAYFPAPETRPVSDIDLLIRPADEALIDKMLERRGFEPGPASPGPPSQREWRRPEVGREPKSLSFVHAEDPWSIDVQTSLNRRYSTGAPTIRLDDVATGAMLGQWQFCSEAGVLRQPLVLLHLAVHASCGFQSLNLLRLVELVLVVRRDTGAGLLSWPEFVNMADSLGALGLIYPALNLCEKLVPGTIPSAVLTGAWGQAPLAVRRFVSQLTPANAQRVVRYSLAEKFMWTGSRRAMLRQIGSDIVPPGINSVSALAASYGTRAWKIARRTLTR